MESPPPVEKPKILIVDDRPENLQILLEILKEDYAVIAATTGEKALTLATKDPHPDLILLDVMMPDLDGYGVCQRLKANPVTQAIPVIFVSAREEEIDETKGFELGAVDYITKPVSPPVVKARLKSHLTIQRLNQSLMATNQGLAEVTRYKDEFLANMTHELRTPLNTILGFSEALQEGIYGKLNDRQANALRTIDASSQHLLSLIGDILDLSKIVAGKLELQQTPTAIAELCRASLLFVQHQAQQKNIQLSCCPPEGLELALLDERRIKQALINLLSNAVKFTPENGTVSLTVTVETPSASDPASHSPRILFQVWDSGIGISTADQEYLFHPFVQINPVLNRQQTGTGLGLALVKKIAELHQGDVWVDSELGKGSCFSMALPLRFPDRNASPTLLSASNVIPFPSSCPLPVSQSPLVLLAEGNPETRQTLSTYLSARRYRVITADNEPAAIALTEIKHPDIILLDTQILGDDAETMVAKLRENPLLATTPLVVMMAGKIPDSPFSYADSGPTHYLAKPFRLKELTYIIDQLVNPLAVVN